jgi:ribosomal protein S18 acetylase RimI-like enzyme
LSSIETDVRIIKPSDWEAYKSLWNEACTESPDSFEVSRDEELARTDAYYQTRMKTLTGVGYFEGETLLGMICLNKTSEAKTRHRATLYNVYFGQACRGTGIVEMVFDVVVDASVQMGVTQLELYVSSGAGRAIGFYKKCGFAKVGSIPAAINVGSQSHNLNLMVKTLEAAPAEPNLTARRLEPIANATARM